MGVSGTFHEGAPTSQDVGLVLTRKRPLPGFQKELILFTPHTTGLFLLFLVVLSGEEDCTPGLPCAATAPAFSRLCSLRLMDTPEPGPAYPVCPSRAAVTQPGLRGDRDSELTIKAALFLSAGQGEGSASQARRPREPGGRALSSPAVGPGRLTVQGSL